jgi:rubredoxin
VSETLPSRYECRICWHVYDPEKGDDVWQIPPGTPFEELPENWSCPVCEALKDKFIRLGEDDA